MKRLSEALALLLSLAMLTACGGKTETDTDTGTSAEETSAADAKEPETEEEFHTAMVERSLYSTGNTYRLKNKIDKARSGEKTTIAYIGGSITEGLTAGKDGCYARLSYEMFKDRYGTGDNVEYVNAGISGTPSNLGVLRLERDVLSQEPDIVFIEFAVNDGQDKTAKESYESLVRTALNSPSQPAVILLFNVIKSGYTAQAHMKEIGEFYGLPMISAADALTAEFEEGRMTWEDYSDDESHPNEGGHRLLCEFIEHMYVSAENTEYSEYTVPAGAKFGAPYENAEMITPDITDSELISLESTGSFEENTCGSGGFGKCWQHGEGDEPVKLKVKGSSFFVIYRRNNNSGMGSFDVFINGEKIKTVNTSQSDGWGEAFSEQIIKFQSEKEMEIEIRCSEGSEDKNVQLLGFAAASNVSF